MSPIAAPVGNSGVITGSSSPSPPSRIGSRLRGKKSIRIIETEYIDQVLKTFSGYIAVDELYDAGQCILAIVDNHAFRRILCRVLDHAATQSDVLELFTDFRQMLELRPGAPGQLKGVTTDGSSLYPAAIKSVFGDVPHQVCRFHVIALLTKAAREAAVALYKKRVARLPRLKQGRPSKGKEQERAQKVRQEREHLLELYRGRYDLVSRELTSERERELMTLLSPYPELAEVRQIMQEIYRLYDGQGASAMEKLAAVRQRAAATPGAESLGPLLSTLNGSCIEKSLVYLDRPELPSTSNAVERSNRRYRKMQKSVYRVRTQRQLRRRLALDMVREQRSPAREQCMAALHQMRAAD